MPRVGIVHPTKISMSAKKRTHYSYYTADGRKLFTKHDGMIPNGRGGYRRFSTTDLYIDGLIVRDGTPLLWQFDGGYVDLDANGAPTSWNYYVTDHLGSTRKVVDSNNNVKETINYYPFGSEMRMQDPAQIQQTDNGLHPFRFTGKELDKQNGLNMYDFGARLFDVAGVPMWTSVDPLAEKYYPFTPYSYCAGDPVNRFDPDGRDWYQQTDEYGATIYQYFEGSNDIEGWTNIGAYHSITNGNKTYYYEQDKMISMIEVVLEEDDWCTQMASPTSKKSGDEGNCFYQAGEMVKRSGATSLGGNANNISGYKEMQNYIDDQIDAGHSIRVWVDRKSKSRDFDGRGDHWVAVSARNTDFRTNEVSYNYYDPGTIDVSKGTALELRFRLSNKTWTAPGPNNNRYNMTNVRKNKK
jgi:RHS repeat-associated protein